MATATSTPGDDVGDRAGALDGGDPDHDVRAIELVQPGQGGLGKGSFGPFASGCRHRASDC
jgi:hypothetical protein